jgi:hypothetical protein
MMLLDPEKQRSGVMKSNANTRMLLEKREEWIVGTLVALFEDLLKISSRLMSVNEENEMKRGRRRRHGDSSMITRAGNAEVSG